MTKVTMKIANLYPQISSTWERFADLWILAKKERRRKAKGLVWSRFE